MNNLGLTLYRYISSFGINPIQTFNGFKNFPSYVKNYFQLSKLLKGNKDFTIRGNYPCLHDKSENGGTANGHYFHQDLLVAKKIFQNNPQKHLDVGSRVDGLIGHLAVFREVEVFDIRSIENKVKNIIFRQSNLMSLDKAFLEYTDSISSLHAIEHFGLGRYGDPIDVNGHIKGLENIYKILKTGGKFYFSVPIGPQRIEFDAHRVFSIGYLWDLFSDKYDLLSFSYVDDIGDLHENVNLHLGLQDNFHCFYGCGIFELIKK